MKYLFIDRAGDHSIWSLVNRIAEALVARGQEVTFCRFDDGRAPHPVPVPDGVRVADISVPPKRYVWEIGRQLVAFSGPFQTLIRQLRPDVVHTHFCVPGVAARLAAYRARVPLVVATQHELYGSMYPHYRCAVRMTLRQADAVVYVSRTVARSFGSTAGVFPTAPNGSLPRQSIIYNGVDLSEADRARRTAGPREPHKLVCAGRFVPEKGHHLLIRALRAIADRFADARLVLAGAGPREHALRQQAADLGLADRVTFAGWLPHDELLAEVATAGATVMPSDGTQEGFGLVVAETMACGTPLVASRIPVFEEVLGGQEAGGTLFAPGDADALTEAVVRVFADPAETARRAGRGRQRVQARFGIDRMVQQYLTLYDAMATRAEVLVRDRAGST